MRDVLAALYLIAMIGFAIWVTTWPCENFNRGQAMSWCYPPEKSIGRAAVEGIRRSSDRLKRWWDGVVIWR